MFSGQRLVCLLLVFTGQGLVRLLLVFEAQPSNTVISRRFDKGRKGCIEIRWNNLENCL